MKQNAGLITFTGSTLLKVAWLAFTKLTNNSEYKRLLKSRNKTQGNLAKKAREISRITGCNQDGPWDLKDVRRLQRHLHTHFVVIDKG